MRRYEHTPLTSIQAWSQRNTTLFETLFVYENYPVNVNPEQAPVRLPHPPSEQEPHNNGAPPAAIRIAAIQPHEQTHYPLTIVAAPGSELMLRIDYDQSRIDTQTAQRIIDHMQRLINALIDDPYQAVQEIDLLTEQERRQILIDWNDTRTDYPAQRCVHELVEEQARGSRTPSL